MERYRTIGRNTERGMRGVEGAVTLRCGIRRSCVLVIGLLVYAAGPVWTQDGATLPVPAALRIESEPSGAEVLLDNRLVGVTPIDIDDLYPGRRRVRIEYRGYRSYDEWISLSAGETTEIEATLELLTGLMEIESDHETLEMNLGGAWEPARAMTLPVGTYRVAFRAFGYESGEQPVSIPPDASTVVPVRLEAVPFSVAYADPGPLRFHPDNLGGAGFADLTLSATGPGWYRVEIYGAEGGTVFARRGTIDDWFAMLLWDGRGEDGLSVPDGTYRVVLEAGDGTHQLRSTRFVEVTHAARVYPRLITPYGSGSSLVSFPDGRGNAVASFAAGGGYHYRETDAGEDHTVPITIAARFAPHPFLAVAAGSLLTASPEEAEVRSLAYGYLEVGPWRRPPGGLGVSLYGNGGTSSVGPWRANRIGAAASTRFDAPRGGVAVVAAPGVEVAVSFDTPDFYAVAGLAAVRDRSRSMVSISSRLTADSDRWRILDTALDTAFRPGNGTIRWTLSLGMSIVEESVDDPTWWSLVSVGTTY
ncbi:MAG: PEGA domain-containing protein [Spirochaetales bacterium]|nr:PEGA domain-containing protein [Spirochaetales bacterium]